MGMTRRLILGALACAPMAVLRAQEPDSGPSCYDKNALSGSQRSMRRSLGFRDVSDSETRRCSSCAFFTATQGECGTCQLLVGGPTTTGSVCNSWAQRPG